jgi:hypothetical protein
MPSPLPPALLAAILLGSMAGLVLAQSQQPLPANVQPPGMRQHTLHQGDFKPAPDPHAFKRPKRDNVFKGGDLARGSINIAAAWFSEPSGRYRHAPFGSDQHPTALTVSTTEKRVLKFRLPKDSVFEDRTPRLVDVDGDGRDEIVVVRSYERKGSALAVIGIRGNELEVIAETPPVGVPFRWLNPIGVADFNGDGKPDIAIVVTPHVQGELQIWTMRDASLVQVGDIDDVSNHAMGSRHLKLSAIADFDGDGRPDIAVPSQDRRRLRFLSFGRNGVEELGEARLPAPAAEDFEVVSVEGRAAVRVGVSGGRTVVIAPCRDIQDWEHANAC